MIRVPEGESLKYLWNLGFGQVHRETLITGWFLDRISDRNVGITLSVLIANTPQALLSFLYLCLNGLLTSLFLAEEWSGYDRQRKPLRTSTCRGQQRSDYFLSLPFRIAIPLTVVSATLHWLCSQAIFLVIIAHYDALGKVIDSFAVATCGFSPMAMILTLLVGGSVVLGLIGLGFRRLGSSMPRAGCCSAAIAAACHGSEPDAYLKPLQWGVVPGSGGESGIEHCCFSSREVTEPVAGKKYA